MLTRNKESRLVRDIVRKSNMLANLLHPEIARYRGGEPITTWHMKDPNFPRRTIAIGGYDVTEKIYPLAQGTDEVFVSMSIFPESYEEDCGLIPIRYLLEVSPPASGNLLGLAIVESSCYKGNVYLPGLRFEISSPVALVTGSKGYIRELIDLGSLSLESLAWYDGNESYDPSKDVNVLLSVIQKDPIQSLEMASYLLGGLLTYKTIHREERIFNPIT